MVYYAQGRIALPFCAPGTDVSEEDIGPGKGKGHFPARFCGAALAGAVEGKARRDAGGAGQAGVSGPAAGTGERMTVEWKTPPAPAGLAATR